MAYRSGRDNGDVGASGFTHEQMASADTGVTPED
jgi:hypothetical protein